MSLAKKLVIIMVPYPLQSHLNMFLNLSHLILSSSNNNNIPIPIHYVSSIQHLNQIKLRHNSISNGNVWGSGDDALLSFHEIPMPSVDNIVDVFRTVGHLKNPVSDLIDGFSGEYEKVVVVHDPLMASVVDHVMDVANAQAYTFHTISTFTFFANLWKVIPEKPFELDSPDVLPTFLPFLPIPDVDFDAFVTEQWTLNFVIDAGNLYNGSRAVEGTYVDLLEKMYPLKKHFAVGPVITRNFYASKLQEKVGTDARHGCLNWLDNKDKDSVIFISFGTTTSIPETQIHELAAGLARSGHNFIWILRREDKGDIFTNKANNQEEVEKLLPEGFLEEVRDRGMVIAGEWVPQLEILAHASVGGFMTHCGWGSLTETVTMGVPVIAYPIHSDQPLNSVLVTEILKTGFLIKDDFWETVEQTITSDIIYNAVKRLMGSDEGVGARKRAKDIGLRLRDGMAPGGVSKLDLESFIAHVAGA